MNTEIITPGQKLKTLRKQYNIKQHELSRNDISRNMISMIENDKANLIESTGKILMENIKTICKQNSIECNISLDYLLESAESQAEKIANEFISIIDITPEKILDNEFRVDFLKLISILDKYNFKNHKALIYEKLGHFYRSKYDYYKAYSYYVTAFENYTNLFNNLDLIKLIIKIDYCCRHLKKHKESIEFLSLAKLYMPNLPFEENYKINYNTVIAHKKLGEFKIALKYITEIENSFDKILKTNSIRTANLNILKANCYTEIKSYDLALKVHQETLNLVEDNLELHLLTLVNILDIYLRLNDRKNIKNILEKCLPLLTSYDNLDNNKYAPNFYFDIGEGFYILEDYIQSEAYLNKSLMESKKYKSSVIIEKNLSSLLKIASIGNDSEKIYSLKNQLLEMLSLEIIKPTNTLVFEFIKYYNSIGDSDTVHDIITFMQNNIIKDSEE